MRSLLLTVSLLLTACATSPSEIRKDEQAHIDTLTLEGEARPLAECTRYHLLDGDPPNAFYRPTPVITEYKDRISLVGKAKSLIAYVADLEPSGGGVTAEVYVNQGYIYREGNGEAVVSALKVCANG